MSLAYRPGRMADGLALTQVWAESYGDLNARHGFPVPPIPVAANPLYTFAAEQPDVGFWVSEEDSQPLGFAISFPHGACWYLSSLFIRPLAQGRGVGRQLIERALEIEVGAGMTNRVLTTFAYNPTSISLYLRYGMYPREPLYVVSGARSDVLARLEASGSSLAVEPVESGLGAHELAVLEQGTLGLRRDLVYRYLLSRSDGSCYAFRDDGGARGYSFIAQSGRVGPVVARTAEDLEAVLRQSLRLAAQQDGVAEVSAIIPGSNEVGMALAIEAGLRIVAPFLLMAARPLAGMDRYLFHSPGLM